MTGNRSNRALRQVHRLFNFGVVGTMSDKQLLDQFVSRRDETAEAAFEELMIRHGPMVLRVCRGVLRDAHDVEDAFQAVFLVLASRASTIRQRGSVASWLFGVAQRVATREKRREISRERLNHRFAEWISHADSAEANDLDSAILHEEIDSLAERLRAPVVLCYLEGQSYGAAAQELGLSEAAVRGRLARARQRLRRRLARRGLTPPACLLVAGASTQSQAAIPGALVNSTIRIALGFISGNAAAILAREVLKSMLLNRLKIVTVLVMSAIGSAYCLWLASAAALTVTDVRRAFAIQGFRDTADEPPEPQAKAPTASARLTGIVKLEGTDQPIPGAKLQISTGFLAGLGSPERIVETDPGGRFSIDLSKGNTRVWLSDPPPGYLVLSAPEAIEIIALAADVRVVHREYRVRKGTIWRFQFTRGSNHQPFPGFVQAFSNQPPRAVPTRAKADGRGAARLTLPTEGSKVDLAVMEFGPLSSVEFRSASIRIALEWQPGFRPDDLAEIARVDGSERGFRMIDHDARTAVLKAPEPIEPVNDNSKLVIRVRVPHRDANDFAALTGQILDDHGQPLAGASVSLGLTGASREPSELQFATTTDPRGRYRLRDIPRRAINGKPFDMQLTVTKEGYAGVQSPRVNLTEGDVDNPQVVDPIRLERGVSISGILVDRLGRPVPGARIQSLQRSMRAGLLGLAQTTNTDENGRFTVPGLRRGVATLHAFHEHVQATNFYMADASGEDVHIELPERMEPLVATSGAMLVAPPKPLAVGRPAPEWQVGPWSDRAVRKLADQRGKVVVLYFWGLAFDRSVSVLPALGKLVAEFAPRGVEFLAIHHKWRDEEVARVHGRKVLAFEGAPLVMAVDKASAVARPPGATAVLYRLQGFPVLIVIDRAGMIAYRSDIPGPGNLTPVFTEMGQSPGTMSEQKAGDLIARTLADEIAKALKQ